MTHSELLFERYLTERGIQYECEPQIACKQKRPDYFVRSKGRSFRFEVKEFGYRESTPVGAYDPLPPVREKIEAARKQFREYKTDCCAVVLHACGSAFRSFHPPFVMSAAFGQFVNIESGSGTIFPDRPLRLRFSGRSILRKDLNTTISAVIILQHFQVEERFVEVFSKLRKRHENGEGIGPLEHAWMLQTETGWSERILHKNSVRAVVLENPYARIRFPSWLLDGPLDQHWSKNSWTRWYEIRRMGSQLVDLRRMPNPVPYAML